MLTTSLHSIALARARQLLLAGLLGEPLTKANVTTLRQERFGQQTE